MIPQIWLTPKKSHLGTLLLEKALTCTL